MVCLRVLPLAGPDGQRGLPQRAVARIGQLRQRDFRQRIDGSAGAWVLGGRRRRVRECKP